MKKLHIILPLLFSFALLTACGGKNNAGKPPAIGLQGPNGAIVDERFGKEVWFSYGAITGTKETPANGLAKSHRFEKGQFMHTLQMNIIMEKEGTFYEGWLKNPATGEKVSVGHVKSIGGDVRHSLTFESTKDLTAYTDVIITLKKDSDNSAEGLTVATAQLKELKRSK
ncbi:MAG: hypothetical protein WCG83_00195 [Candidatus Peregrinibacteria bacterium]